MIEGMLIALRERVRYSHLSETEKNDCLRQLQGVFDDDSDLEKIGREALLAEFRQLSATNGNADL